MDPPFPPQPLAPFTMTSCRLATSTQRLCTLVMPSGLIPVVTMMSISSGVDKVFEGAYCFWPCSSWQTS